MAAVVLAYGIALWLGLYLAGRDPRSPRLMLTGGGLLAYALAVACDLLSGTAPPDLASILASVREPLLLLPALLWTGALAQLPPEDSLSRRRLVGLWLVIAAAAASLVAAGLGTGLIAWTGAARLSLGAAVLAPMLAFGGVAGWSSRARRGREAVGVLVVFTLFFALSTALILSPASLFPRTGAMLLVGVDLISLGLAIAFFDAFDLGEALLPDMIRSFDAAFLSALVFGGQVALVILLATGPTAPMLILLLATIATAIAIPTFADALSSALDGLALGRLSRVAQTRSELRAVARALPRANPTLDPSKLDEDEFVRLTRRALSSFGDLPRLSASPLANLPLVPARLAARNAPGDPLERAAELKALLAESIARLKPRTDAGFGASDEWRYYNALHFPYVVGLKPYSARNKTKPTDPAEREALEWFRASVPERTLYNWQNAAARLVARDLLARNGSSSR